MPDQATDPLAYLRAAPAALVLAGFAAFDFYIALWVDIGTDSFGGIIIGGAFAQVAPIAVLTALARFHAVTRWVGGTVGSLLVAIAVYACVLREAHDVGGAIAMASALLVQWVVYQIPLWQMRLAGWHVLEPGASDRRGPDPIRESQFGIKHLLVWTTVVAVFLAVIRMTSSVWDWDGGGAPQAIAVFAVLALSNSVLVLPALWAALGTSRLWLWGCLAVLWAIAITTVEVSLTGGSVGGLGAIFFVMLNLTQLLAAMVALIALRLAGLRLVHAE